MKVTQFPPNTFSWVDLATSDATAAKEFYCNLFDWTALDLPTGESPYSMLSLGGDNVCALWEMNDQMKGQGVPPHWQSYISVENVDAMAQRAAKLGGTIAMPPFDVMQAGRMAFIADPTAATVALWQKKDHHGADRVNEPGTFCWNELMTRDAAAAEKFYTELLGWTTVHSPGPLGGEYIEFRNGERQAGGMLQIRPDMGGMPSHWGVYFAVADCDAALKKATALGAKAMMPPVDIEGVGRFSARAGSAGRHVQRDCPLGAGTLTHLASFSQVAGRFRPWYAALRKRAACALRRRPL